MQHRRWLILLGFSLTATVTGCQSTNWSTAEKGNAPRSKSASVASTAPKTAPSTAKSKFSRKTVDELMADGARLERAEQRTEAVAVYSLVVEREPDHAEAHHRLGILSDLKGDYVAAEKHYRVALSQKPDNPDLLSDLGYSYSLRGNHREAEEILRQALANDPGHVQAINNLAQVYGEQGRFEEAVATLRKVRSEAEARQALAELFPGKFPAGGGSTDWAQMAVASRDASPPASAGTPTPSASDLSKMSIEQIRALMEQQRQDALRERRLRDEQVLARQEMIARQAQAADWAGNPAVSPATAVQQTAGMPAGNSAAQGAGPFGNYSSTVPPNGLGNPSSAPRTDAVPGADLPFFQGNTNSAPMAATPRAEAAPLPVIQPADFGKPPSWAGQAAQGEQPANVPVANTPSAALPPGPILPTWANLGAAASTTSPNMATPPNMAALQPAPNVGANNQPMPAAAPPASMQTVSVPTSSMQYRAAQLGLQIGPGVLFPTVSSSVGGLPSSTPNRFGSEFPNTPAYSTPVDPAFGSAGETPSSGPTLPPGNANSTSSIRVAPNSPATNWTSPWDRTATGVQTAGGVGSAGNSAVGAVAPAGAWSTNSESATATGDPFGTASPSMNSNAPRQQMSTAPWPPRRSTNSAPTTVNKPMVNPNEPPLWPHAPR